MMACYSEDSHPCRGQIAIRILASDQMKSETTNPVNYRPTAFARLGKLETKVRQGMQVRSPAFRRRGGRKQDDFEKFRRARQCDGSAG